MKMKPILIAAGALSLAGAVQAAISPGNGADGDPTGELFLTVWDPVNEISYTRDLGLDLADVVNNPTQTLSISADSLYGSTFDNVGLEYSLGACNIRFDDFPTPGYGVLLTSNQAPATISVPDFTALTTVGITCGQYARGANTTAGDLTDFPANNSSTNVPGEEGYYDGPNWGGNVGNSVPFQTGAPACKYLSFHALTLNTDGTNVDTDNFTNRWRLGADGTLSYGVADTTDTDGDGFFDVEDNCIDVSNPDQRDTDGDGFGNICDQDISGNGAIGFEDLGLLKTAFFSNPASPNWNPNADFDGNDAVGFEDLGLLRSNFFGSPGPSGCQ